VPRLFRRYERAALIPAINTGFRVTQVNTAPFPRISIIPVSRAVRKAIKSPLIKSLQSSVKSFEFIFSVFKVFLLSCCLLPGSV
jgi:hypothetical protein